MLKAASPGENGSFLEELPRSAAISPQISFFIPIHGAVGPIMLDVAIVGAGPYGLSIAAHLAARGVRFRIFGRPMETWREHMPSGMHLKSEGFASFLYDPDAALTLASYCKAHGLPYADEGIPVPLETFVSYGMTFQTKFVPQLEDRHVVTLRRSADVFEIILDSGESVTARAVVLAIGLTYYHHVPSILSTLPSNLVTHSSMHRDVQSFSGRNVAVVGAGASALDLAALLFEAGAMVKLICRKSSPRIHDPPNKRVRSLFERIRAPTTGIGNGWKSFWCVNAPLIFRLMPERFRLEKVRQIAGPAGGWFIKERVVGKLPFLVGVNITNATVENNRVCLELTNGAGAKQSLLTDHVIAATGYKVDLRRLSFLDAKFQSEIRAVDHTPVLSSNFECSIPGLYFVGTSAANTFGPVLRFAFGARFTARRLSRHLAGLAIHVRSRHRVDPNIEAPESETVHGRETTRTNDS